jgi:HAMP domain-containing protein
MLRRKLLLVLSPLVALLVLTAVVSIWSLQGILNDLAHIEQEAWTAVQKANELSIAVNAIEVDLYDLELGRQRHLDALIGDVEALRDLVREMGGYYVIEEAAPAPIFERIRERIEPFERVVASLATAQDPDLVRRYTQEALSTAVILRQDTLPLSRHVLDHAHHEQQELSGRFRWLVLGLALVFVFVINISIMVLLRMASMVLRPVDKLVEATRELGRENYEHRVTLEQKDEFDELAAAYNHMAEQLATNEQRRMEMLKQVALAMNHELNNAIATIELQLQLLDRQSNDRPTLEKRLRQIRSSLQRMTHTVESLKQIRRVVLTDYISGMKMLDLERSVRDSSDLSSSDPDGPRSQAASASSL